MLHRRLPKDLEVKFKERFGSPSSQHPNHKGMIDWIRERSGGLCECPGGEHNGGKPGSQRCQNPIDHIHHLVYPNRAGQERAWMLRGLCKTCHGTYHEKNSVVETLPCCKYRHQIGRKPYVYPVIEA